MSRSARRELETRLVIRLADLLKWRFQLERAGASWRRTMRDQRWAILSVIERRSLTLYPRAVGTAEREAPLLRGSMPAECPFDVDEVLDPGYLPSSQRS